ncbi:MAG: TatD family hydrolase [Christensenella sp.]|nr:TatD family hydrolase [Christensenella sp.]
MDNTMLIDTHTHLLDERFDEDRQAVVAALGKNGLEWIVENSSDLAGSIAATAFAREYAAVYAAVGVHPHSAQEWDDQTETALRTLLSEPKVVALGEIGLDYHYDFSPRETQRAVFEKQVAIAAVLDVPFVVHSREATADTMEILRGYPQGKGELHCFSGSAQTARELVKMGYYIGIGGSLTFKNARKTIEAAQEVPLGRILLETDCPYMTPVPLRGQRNEPAYVKYVAQKLAEVKNISVDEVARATAANAKEFFRI